MPVFDRQISAYSSDPVRWRGYHCTTGTHPTSIIIGSLVEPSRIDWTDGIFFFFFFTNRLSRGKENNMRYVKEKNRQGSFVKKKKTAFPCIFHCSRITRGR
jgi:hypothetical protein